MAAQAGDRQALETLLARHYPRVTAVARRLLRHDADAADATQEALMAAVRGLHRFDRQAAFSTWLYRITVNTCLDQLRRQRRRPTVAFDPTREQGEPTSGAPAIDAALADRLELQAALAELPEDFRIAVVLRDVADLEYLDIAEILGVPVGTVRSRIARGRAALAARLGNQPGSWRHPTERP